MMVRWLLCGLILFSACTTLPVQEAVAPPASVSHPLGYTLPPDAPQLYDNAVYARFHHVARRPYQVHGVQFAPWLMATIADEIARGTAMGREVVQPVLLIHRVGYVTDGHNRQHEQILALVETIIDPVTEYRRIQFWLDMGWVKNGKADGTWSTPRGTTTPVSREEAADLMEPVHLLVAHGYLQYATSHGLPVPTIPVVPVRTERKHHAAGR